MTARIVSPSEAVARIRDGATIAITGSGGGLLEPDTILAALGERFRATGHPRDLTIIHAQGIGDGATRGLNHIALEGMIRRVIGAHWTWSPAMQTLAAQEKIEAFALPGGAIQHLAREIGAKRPGLVTKVGLDSFVDPNLHGGAMNARATAAPPIVERITIDGEDYLRYRPFSIDVAIVRGTSTDIRGNIDFADEGGELDAVVLAMAARNCNGQVLAQVRDHVAMHSRPAAAVRLPGSWIDAVVVDPGQRWSHAGEARALPPAASEKISPERRIIARRAADEIKAGNLVSFGFGIPDGVATVVLERGLLPELHTTVDHGHHGGDALQGPLFGFVPNGEARIDSPTQFDFYSGGGIDVAVLGFGECDAQGNVNVSKLGGKIIGPGGFIDIAQNAKAVIFCGTFETKGLRIEMASGQLRIVQPGAIPKFVPAVEQVTFSARQARRAGQQVLYVTERAVFQLSDQGLILTEIAPGLDIERDIIARMGFHPILPDGGPALMPSASFA